MARRRELKNISAGITDSFSSRNNDVDGYWGLGKLYAFVATAPDKTITLELVGRHVSPSTDEFNRLISFYREMLFRYLKKRNMPESWVRSASITTCFEVEYQPEHHFWRSSLGKPCTIVCDIIADTGRHYVAMAYNNCRPHDPALEVRSTRAGNI